jgi:glutaredoxin 3
MGELLGRTSVPAVWIDGKFVGGCNDGPMGGLVKLDEAGDLDGMLKAAGSI